MSTKAKPRLQCKTCPWKRDADVRAIPGYSRKMHEGLACTIAEPGAIHDGARIMACHYSTEAAPIACVGWIANQLGPGNNIRLRLMVVAGTIDGNVKTVGPQKMSFGETLQRPR